MRVAPAHIRRKTKTTIYRCISSSVSFCYKGWLRKETEHIRQHWRHSSPHTALGRTPGAYFRHVVRSRPRRYRTVMGCGRSSGSSCFTPSHSQRLQWLSYPQVRRNIVLKGHGESAHGTFRETHGNGIVRDSHPLPF